MSTTHAAQGLDVDGTVPHGQVTEGLLLKYTAQDAICRPDESDIYMTTSRPGALKALQLFLEYGTATVWILAGKAKSGKTYLTRALASSFERAPNNDRYVIATFFGLDSRATGDVKTTPVERLITTILYQLNHKLGLLLPAPDTFDATYGSSLETQMEQWIIEPLKKIENNSKRVVIIVDSPESFAAESNAEESNADSSEPKMDLITIMEAFAHLVKSLSPMVHVVVATRAKFQAESWAQNPMILPPATVVDLAGYYIDTDAAIGQYIQQGLPSMGLSSGSEKLNFLVNFCAGSFGLAVSFVDYFRNRSARELPLTIEQASTSPGFYGLDSTYIDALSRIPPEDRVGFCKVIAYALLRGRLSPTSIPWHFSFSRDTVFKYLFYLQGIVDTPGRYMDLYAAHHHSFTAFLVDPTRSGEFYVPDTSSF